ncbi:MAG: HD domain-containing protein [Desulfobacter sp.]|nr:MAG: HD domain-containing protein [Desulfobacter sp.]
MSDYFPIRPSQVQFLKTIPFYHQSKDGEYLLYKQTGDLLDHERASQTRHPQLFIEEKDKAKALNLLTRTLNMDLAKQVAEGGLVQIKTALSNIVREILEPGQEAAMTALPETLDILLENMSQDHTTMDYLGKITTTSKIIVEHTVNVLALTLQYCFFLDLSEKDTQTLGLCALLHDVGTSTLDREIIESKERLTQSQFKTYQTHAQAGHDMILLNAGFDLAVANTALEHHERLDKSGYPNATDISCRQSQIIGFIDSYESLTYRSKAFRKARTPFDTLNLIKKEVKEGKFSLKLFKEFTSCLIR